MTILTFIVGAVQTNCYFVIDEKTSRCAVIDPGADAKRLLHKAAGRGLTISQILLTHGHFDHMLALEELRRVTGAPLAIHRLDAPALTNSEINCMRRFISGAELNCRQAERLIEHGDIIEIGEINLTVMHTPGHTIGSVCYLSDGVIFSGDTLFRDGIGRYDLCGGDYSALCESLASLRDLDGDYRIFPGHGSTTSLSHERANNPHLAMSQPDAWM